MKKIISPFASTLTLMCTPLLVHAEEHLNQVDGLANKLVSEQHVRNTGSMGAYTGVYNTPNSAVIDYGVFNFNYSDNYFDASSRFNQGGGIVRAHDLKFGVGILPNVEVVGRLGTRSWDNNCYEASGCGFRDLSASLKWQLPYIPQDWFQVALGVQDLGGASNYSETFYGVVSKEFSFSSFGELRLNAGLASADNNIDYLDGFIASAEYQYNEVLQFAGEYDASSVNLGIKLFTPKAWLPQGWDLYLSTQLYSSKDERNEHDQWFALGVSIPLGASAHLNTQHALVNTNHSNHKTASQSSADSYKQDAVTNAPIRVVKEKVSQPSSIDNLAHLQDIDVERVNDLAEQLSSHGFESIFIGVNEGALLVRFENNVYNRNERDGLMAAVKIIRNVVGDLNTKIEVTNYGLITLEEHLFGPDVRVVGKNEQNKEAAWYTPSFGVSKTKQWIVANEQNAHFVPRITFAPHLNSLVGTEYGSFDYQLTLSSNLQMSLWDGAVVDIRHISDTLLHSDDFDDGEYFYRKYGSSKGIDRRLFHQTVSLPFNVFTKFSYGRIYGNSDGLLNETRWQSADNTHRVTTLWGDFKDKRKGWRGDRTYYKPKLVKYRYRFEALNWDMEATAGEYWNGDKGFTLRSLHWFGNTQVGLKYKKSKFDGYNGRDDEEEDFIAIGFSIPLNFNKSMKPNYGFQLKGIEQWNYSVETLLTTEGNANSIKTNFGQEPLLYHNLNQAYFNRDR